MTINEWSQGKQLILFSKNLSVSWGGNFDAGNSLNLTVMAVVGQQALLHSDIIDFAILSTQRFWREQFYVRYYVTWK